MSATGNQYRHSDEQGSYTICFGDRTVEVKFVGFLSEQLIEKLCNDLGLMLRVIEWRFWGYYGDLTECEDESATSRDCLVELHKSFLQKGCVVDAYTIINSTAIEHVVKSRRNSGVEHYLLDENLFSERQQAIDYIHNILRKIDKKQLNQK